MKILYLINQYPKVSHTFIRREILSIEAQGIEVQRVAMRSEDPSGMSQIDQSEFAKTHFVLKQSKIDIVKHVIEALVSEPKRFFKALTVLFKMNRASKQSVLIHLIYLVESCNVANVCKAKKIDHIHAHFGINPAEVAMYTSIISGVPYSVTVHGSEEFDKPETINLHQKIKYASKIIAISHYGKSQLLRWADYSDWHKVRVVHCGLEQDFFDDSRVKQEKTSEEFQFLCIGRLCNQKGQLLLLEAFNRFVKQGKNAHLTLAGDGDMRDDVDQFIATNNLENNVTITGWIESKEIKQLLKISDAMLLPSFAEGLPVAIMEAMATGVPVISTAITGIPELIKHNESGILVCPGSIEALEDGLNTFAEMSHAELMKMKMAAYDAVSKRHNIDTEAAKLANIFAESCT